MYGVDWSLPSSTIAKCWAYCWMTFGSLLVWPAAAASAAPRCASARVMSWNFLLPSLLKPSWTNAAPWPACVPTCALIAPLLRSLPVASGIGVTVRFG